MSREGGWHRSVVGMVRRTVEAAVEDNVPFLASALAFDFILTAIPFLILVLASVGYLVQHELATQNVNVHDVLSRFLPGGAASLEQLERTVLDVVSRREQLTLVGAPLFVWFSTRLFGGLRVALNEVFDVHEPRPIITAKLRDLGMVLVMGSLFTANTVLSAGVTFLAARSTAAPGWVWGLSLELLAFVFSAVLFFMVYKLIPGRPIYWRTAVVAAVFGALGFEIAKQLYALYLTEFATFDRLVSDANIVALFLFLLWIYVSAFIFLLGGEVAETYDMLRLRRTQRVGLG